MITKNPLFLTLLALEALGWEVDFVQLAAQLVTTEGVKHVLIEMECVILPDENAISFGCIVHVRYPLNDAARALLVRLRQRLDPQKIALSWSDVSTIMFSQKIDVPHVFEAWSAEAFLGEISERSDVWLRLVFSCIHALNACARTSARKDRAAQLRIAPEYLVPFCLFDIPDVPRMSMM